MTENVSDALPQLDATQARVIACLIEKAALTPEVYPMTVNAIVTAANQKTSRDPVMSLELGEVGHCLRKLEDRGFVKVVHSARALRYEHRFDEVYGVTGRQRAVLCLLLLRGPQTLSELFARSDRLADFDSADAVREILERLSARSPTMVVNLGRASGQREDRYMHLLSGPVSADAYMASVGAERASSRGELEQRVDALEAEVAALKAELAELRDAYARHQPSLS